MEAGAGFEEHTHDRDLELGHVDKEVDGIDWATGCTFESAKVLRRSTAASEEVVPLDEARGREVVYSGGVGKPEALRGGGFGGKPGWLNCG